MIIKNIEKLREMPVGTEVLYVQKIKVVEAKNDEFSFCKNCIFTETECPSCRNNERPDGKEVKFVKI